MNAPPLLLPSLQLRGIVRRIRGRLAAELVIFLLGVMGNHYGAIWWRYGFVSSFLSGEREGCRQFQLGTAAQLANKGG